jgi:hypothetical protein
MGVALVTSLVLDPLVREQMGSAAGERSTTEDRLTRIGNAMGRPQLSLPLLVERL